MSQQLLVIEDNVQNMYLMKFLLECHGFSILEAVDGFEGLRMAKEHKPVLILLDIQLPGMDGYAVAHALKQEPLTRDIPIVAVTSYAMVGDRERILSEGANGYIEKPINPETFIAEIMPFLE